MEEEWPEFTVKFQAFLAMKVCAEVIQNSFKSKLSATEDEELNASTELGKAKKSGKINNVMVYMTQSLSGMAMLNANFNV